MAFNAFTGVTLSADRKTVILDGRSRDPFKAARIDAAIIDPDDEDRRLQGHIDGDGVELANPWPGIELAQSGLEDGRTPFEPGEKVIVAGVATALDGEVFVWGGIVGEEPDMLHPKAQIGAKEAPPA